MGVFMPLNVPSSFVVYCACACVCARERVRAHERACVRAGKRERECVCVCVFMPLNVPSSFVVECAPPPHTRTKTHTAAARHGSPRAKTPQLPRPPTEHPAINATQNWVYRQQ